MEGCVRIMFVMAVCLSVRPSVISGLKCYTCGSVSVDTADTSVTEYLATLFENAPKCGALFDPAGHNVDILSCNPKAGREARCRSVKLTTVFASFQNVNFSGSFYNRGCFGAAVGSPDGCFESTQM